MNKCPWNSPGIFSAESADIWFTAKRKYKTTVTITTKLSVINLSAEAMKIRSLAFILLLMIGNTFFARSGNSERIYNTDIVRLSSYNLNKDRSFRIEKDDRVTFKFCAPNAQETQVSTANIPFEMVNCNHGVWLYTSKPQNPDCHNSDCNNYCMIIDGDVVFYLVTQGLTGNSLKCNGLGISNQELTTDLTRKTTRVFHQYDADLLPAPYMKEVVFVKKGILFTMLEKRRQNICFATR